MSPALAVTGTGKFGWGSLLASGDFDFITSASGTAVSSLSIDNCFSAGYDHYLVMRNLLGSSADASLRLRLRASSTDSTGTDYRYQSLEADSTTVASGRSTGQAYWTNGAGWASTTSYGFTRTWISNPFAAVRTTAWNDAALFPDGAVRLESTVFEHDLTTSYDGLTVYPASGTITGSIYVYGLAV